MPIAQDSGLPPVEEKKYPCELNASAIARLVMTAPSG